MNEKETVWYLPGGDNQPAGPYTTDQIIQWCRSGQLDGKILCWSEGMDDWRPLAETATFSNIFVESEFSNQDGQATDQEIENLGQAFNKALSFTKKKAKIVSLKMAINKHEKRKQQILFELGKMLYERESNNEILTQSPYIEKIYQARAEDESIQELRKEIEALEPGKHA
jgi:hypothetical protein